MNKRTNTFKGEHTMKLRTEVLDIVEFLDSEDWRDGITAIQELLKYKGYGIVKKYHIKKILKDLSYHGFIKEYSFYHIGTNVIMSKGYIINKKIL